MKNQILDEFTRDSFVDFLDRGETILWQASSEKSGYNITPTNTDAKPKKEQSIILNIISDIFFEIFGVVFLGIFFILLSPFIEKVAFWGLGILIFFIAIFYHRLKKKPTQYAITNQRILFKSTQSRKVKIYEIPFSEINNCVVVEHKNKRGTIFLAVKNPEAIPFDTFTILDTHENVKQHQPTLENIKSPQDIAKLIRQGIQQNN